jgi:hypothetical protein
MATADHRRGATPGAVLRWTRAAVIALVAALAVLVHHETAAAMTPAAASETGSHAGMHHAAAPTTPVEPSGLAMMSGTTAPPAPDAGGTCSGTAMQHCSAAGVDTMKLAPPHRPFTGCAPGIRAGHAVGRDVPGAADRAPPDLSVLSRLLL